MNTKTGAQIRRFRRFRARTAQSHLDVLQGADIGNPARKGALSRRIRDFYPERVAGFREEVGSSCDGPALTAWLAFGRAMPERNEDERQETNQLSTAALSGGH